MHTLRNILKERNRQLEINFRVKDFISQQSVEFNFTHTRHSLMRASQRGIDSKKIKAALQFGEPVYKQGMIFYILGENNIPDMLIKEKNQLKNTIVVVSGNSNQIITCYRSANPFRNVKIKPKQLCIGYAA